MGACCRSIGLHVVAASVFWFCAVPGHVVPPLAFEASSGFFLDFFDIAFFPTDYDSISN